MGAQKHIMSQQKKQQKTGGREEEEKEKKRRCVFGATALGVIMVSSQFDT